MDLNLPVRDLLYKEICEIREFHLNKLTISLSFGSKFFRLFANEIYKKKIIFTNKSFQLSINNEAFVVKFTNKILDETSKLEIHKISENGKNKKKIEINQITFYDKKLWFLIFNKSTKSIEISVFKDGKINYIFLINFRTNFIIQCY
jgi:hypothetical protein